MDGKGRYLDKIFIERLWRSLKYQEVYIKTYGSVAVARLGLGLWLTFCTTSGRTRRWITGRRARCSERPASRYVDALIAGLCQTLPVGRR